jgi:hypothetical protein
LPTQWVDRDDRTPGACPEGPVTDEETLARCLNPEIWRDGKLQESAFQKKIPLRKVGDPINNEPGARDGESLIRCSTMSPDEILAIALELRPIDSQGVVLAQAEDIRAIAPPEQPSARLFYVYEDPMPDKPMHAVIRYSDDERFRPFWPQVRRKLIELFEQRKL